MAVYLKSFIQGLIIGAAMTIPGISGGTLALVLNIYDKLINAVCSLTKNFVKNMLYLGSVALGGVIGMVTLSKLVLWVFERYQLPMNFLFFGAIVGSIPLLYRKSHIKKAKDIDWKFFAYQLIGVAVVLLIAMMPSNLVGETTGFVGVLLLLLAGFLAAVALILPGISLSFILLVLGIYEKTFNAVHTLDFKFLLPLGISAVIFALLLAKLLEFSMREHPKPTFLVIAGFVIGSLFSLVEELPTGWNIPICILTFAGGFMLVYLVSRKSD